MTIRLISKKDMSFAVKSNTTLKKEYQVKYLRDFKKWECNCKGFGYRKHCSHIDCVLEWIKNNGDNL